VKPYLSRSGLGNDASAAGAFHTFHAWPKGPPTCSSIKGTRQSGYSEDIMSLDLCLRKFPFPSSFMFRIYIAYTHFLLLPFFWMESVTRKTSPASTSFSNILFTRHPHSQPNIGCCEVQSLSGNVSECSLRTFGDGNNAQLPIGHKGHPASRYGIPQWRDFAVPSQVLLYFLLLKTETFTLT